MKIRNVTSILMLSAFILFTMCKKEKNNSPNPPGNTGNGSNTNRPQLVSFSPEKGAIGDTVSITGVNFTGNSNSLKVSFGNTPTNVMSASTSTTNNVKYTVIKVLVPEMADISTKINLQVDTLLLTSEKSFTRIAVTEFTGFSPANGYIGDTITLTGAFYEKTPVVSFGDVAAKVISKDSKTLKAIVPDDIANATAAINVAIDGQTITSKTSFTLNAPVIDAIDPTTAFLGQGIRIKGKGFRNSYKYKQVYLDNSLITATPESNTSIFFNIQNVGTGLHNIAVEVAGLKTQAKDAVKLIAPEITAVTPDSVTEDDILIIKGHHLLSPNEVPTFVTTVDNNGMLRNFIIQSITDDEIHVIIPILGVGKYKITVAVLRSSVTYDIPFTWYKEPI
ncbi:MAG: IPT/TIG domain-containing protein [Niastella sp.]|uniref:IPT/TIG domain-containing protein n=1 Tax=Niastella sp. TaxID=1869183 RepID=UPI00389A351F